MQTTTLELRSPDLLEEHLRNMKDSGRVPHAAGVDDDGLPFFAEYLYDDLKHRGQTRAIIKFHVICPLTDLRFPVKVLHPMSGERRPTPWDVAMRGKG